MENKVAKVERAAYERPDLSVWQFSGKEIATDVIRSSANGEVGTNLQFFDDNIWD